jgi:multidrug efflux pump subunit AcrA (membrane-fusion protein)
MDIIRVKPFSAAPRSLVGGLVCLGLAFSSGPAWTAAEAESSSSPTSETHARVKVVPLREGTLPLTLRVLGKVNAIRQIPAALAALSEGTVSQVLARGGEEVSSGTVLLRLDDRMAQAELRKARSDLALAERELRYSEASGMAQEQEELDLSAGQARVLAEQAARESERLSKLLAKELTSEKAATEARQAAETGRKLAIAAENKASLFRRSGRGLGLDRLLAKVEEAKAAVRLAELKSEAMVVRAPLAGRVTSMHVSVGQSVEKGAPLVELQASKRIGAAFALPPARACQVRPAMPFALRDEQTSRTYQGTIIAVGAGVNPDSGLVQVEGLLDLKNTQRPYLGEVLPGKITIGQSPRGLIVPAAALSVTDEGAFVHLMDEQHKARQVPVQVLMQSRGEALIQDAALKAGLRVIRDGNYNLPDGAGVVEDRP